MGDVLKSYNRGSGICSVSFDRPSDGKEKENEGVSFKLDPRVLGANKSVWTHESGYKRRITEVDDGDIFFLSFVSVQNFEARQSSLST